MSNLKFGYRARVGFLVAVIGLLGGLFYFLMYQPGAESLRLSKMNLEAVEKKQAEIQADLDRKPGLENDIREGYKTSQDLSKNFLPVGMMNPKGIEEYAQKIVDEFELWVDGSFDLGEASITTLSYDFNTNPNLIYPLFEAADINGEIAAELAEKSSEIAAIVARDRESVLLCTLSIDFRAEKDSIMGFMDKIKSIRETVKVDVIRINDYTFGEDSDNREDLGFSEGTISIVFYAIEPMAKPNNIPGLD